MQVTYGIATSTEVAYFTYIYAKVLQLIFIIIVIIIIVQCSWTGLGVWTLLPAGYKLH